MNEEELEVLKNCCADCKYVIKRSIFRCGNPKNIKTEVIKREEWRIHVYGIEKDIIEKEVPMCVSINDKGQCTFWEKAPMPSHPRWEHIWDFVERMLHFILYNGRVQYPDRGIRFPPMY